MNRATFKNRPPEDGPPVRLRRIAREIINFFFSEAEGRCDRIGVTLAPTNNAGICLAQPYRRTYQCPQDCRQIKGRLADNFENFGGRCLLLQRFVPLPGDPSEGCCLDGGWRTSALRRFRAPRPGRFGSCPRATWHWPPEGRSIAVPAGFVKGWPSSLRVTRPPSAGGPRRRFSPESTRSGFASNAP